MSGAAQNRHLESPSLQPIHLTGVVVGDLQCTSRAAAASEDPSVRAVIRGAYATMMRWRARRAVFDSRLCCLEVVEMVTTERGGLPSSSGRRRAPEKSFQWVLSLTTIPRPLGDVENDEVSRFAELSALPPWAPRDLSTVLPYYFVAKSK